MEKDYLKFIKTIEIAYDKLLTSSFSKGFWEGDEYENQRIKWTDINKVKTSLKILNESGVYIWGHKKEPIYIGKAEKQSFKKRFNRYIFSKNSQCKIAENYRIELSNGGEILGIEEIIEKYNLNPKNHKSRAIGIKTFGECDSNDIWFILLPYKKDSISGLEISLIKAGEIWNNKKNLNPLINLDK